MIKLKQYAFIKRVFFIRALVFADTHGATATPLMITRRLDPDIVIHLGDLYGDMDLLIKSLPQLPVVRIRGNNDVLGQPSAFLDIGGAVVFMTHGHLYDVYNGPLKISLAAREVGATLALFGHTHFPFDEFVNGVRVVNPGSVMYPRQGSLKTFATIDIWDKNMVKVKIVEVQSCL